MLRFLMIIWLIGYCLKLRVNPWWFFQLNANYFNKKKGIYSKQEINRLIPLKWRLRQYYDNPAYFPIAFPVFLKPEWGQNSYGVYRADTLEHLQHIRKSVVNKRLSYLIQEAAREEREYEIFYVRNSTDFLKPSVFTITEVRNSDQAQYPVNGVHNGFCTYRDASRDFNTYEQEQLWNYLSQIGRFWMARVCLKTRTITDMVQGQFHIVEINLFTPMPLNLLDPAIDGFQKLRFIKETMLQIAYCIKEVSLRNKRENIFFRKLLMHYKVKS